MAIPLASGAAEICFPPTYKGSYERRYRLMDHADFNRLEDVAEVMPVSATSGPER